MHEASVDLRAHYATRNDLVRNYATRDHERRRRRERSTVRPLHNHSGSLMQRFRDAETAGALSRCGRAVCAPAARSGSGRRDGQHPTNTWERVQQLPHTRRSRFECRPRQIGTRAEALPRTANHSDRPDYPYQLSFPSSSFAIVGGKAEANTTTLITSICPV